MKMKQVLLTGTALAFAGAMVAGQASAADKMSVSVGGYMEQWVGMNDIDGATSKTAAKAGANDDGTYKGTPATVVAKEGGVAQWSDSEIFFRGKLEADNGLTFSVKVELEGNTSGDTIDESQMTVSGSFGQIVLGTEDHPAALMHYGNQDVGVGYCGDVGWTGVVGCSRNDKMGLGTNGWIVGGDEQKIAYYTPRMNGIQFGMAYIPDHTAEDKNSAPNNNDSDGFSVAANMQQDVGEASVALSAGHYQASMAGDEDQTWSNFGLRVGFGEFGFNVAYAEHEDGDGDDTDTGNYNLTSVGAKYMDGPMAVSLTHMMGDADNGQEANATMLSLAYKLAPGVSSKSSIIAGEQGTVEGTAFVTGIAVGF